VLEVGAVCTLERDRRAGTDGPLERAGGGDRGAGERGGDHKAHENETGWHLADVTAERIERISPVVRD
jgi:hypothetical protein